MSIYIPYFYIIRHISSNKMYAGAKWGKDANPDEFMTANGYQTSSRIIKSIIEIEGLTSFEILRIDTNCDGLSPYEYETLFLNTCNCSSSSEWLNGHPNRILNHSSEEFKSIMIKLYGVDHWAKTDEGREFHRQKTKERNMMPENIAKWYEMNTTNNPGAKPENRKKSADRLRERNNIKYENGDHPMQIEENKIKASERMKATMKAQPIIVCPHCGLSSNNKSNMIRWHLDNCKHRHN